MWKYVCVRVYVSVIVSVSECRQRMCEAGLPKIIKIKQQTKGKRGLPAKPKTSKYKQVHETEKYGWRGRGSRGKSEDVEAERARGNRQASERDRQRPRRDVIVIHIVNVRQAKHQPRHHQQDWHWQQDLHEDINSFIQMLLLEFQQWRARTRSHTHTHSHRNRLSHIRRVACREKTMEKRSKER